MKFLVCIAALFVVASAAPSEKNLLTDVIKNLFENNKDKLANLIIDEIILGDEGEFGSIRNLAFKGLDNINIDRLDSDGPLSVSISNGTVSLVQGSAVGDFDFQKIQVPELGLLLNGNGVLSGIADNLWATLKLKCKLNGLAIQVEDFTEFAILVGKITASLPGIDNEEGNTQIINNDLADFLTANLPEIAYKNKVVILEKVNEILAGISFE